MKIDDADPTLPLDLRDLAGLDDPQGEGEPDDEEDAGPLSQRGADLAGEGASGAGWKPDPWEAVDERWARVVARGMRLVARRIADRYGLSLQWLLTANARGRPVEVRDARLLFMRSCRRKGISPRETGELLGMTRTGVMAALNSAGFPSLRSPSTLADVDLWAEELPRPAPVEEPPPEPVEGRAVGPVFGSQEAPGADYWAAWARWIEAQPSPPAWARWAMGAVRE